MGERTEASAGLGAEIDARKRARGRQGRGPISHLIQNLGHRVLLLSYLMIQLNGSCYHHKFRFKGAKDI